MIEKIESFRGQAEQGRVDAHAISWFATQLLSRADVAANANLRFDLIALANMAVDSGQVLDRFELILTLNRLAFWYAAEAVAAPDLQFAK